VPFVNDAIYKSLAIVFNIMPVMMVAGLYNCITSLG